MKLIISIVNKDDSAQLLNALVSNGYRVTQSQTSGGFLRKANVTMFTGVADEQVEEVIHLIRENCHTRTQNVGSLPPVMESGSWYILDTEETEVEIGGAVVFVLDIAQFLKT